MMQYKIGARGSRLSMAQTEWVAGRLGRAHPGSSYTITPIRTRGDADPRPLFAVDQKGIFEREIDRAVAAGEVDFAVHSLKDVPSELPPGIILACVPERGPANDVVVSPDGAGLDDLAKGGTVGTSSLRRAVQVQRYRPDLRIMPIRGNVESRIGRVPGKYDAIILAQAGICRLGLDILYSALPAGDYVPSPGQGALAITARAGDARILKMLGAIEDGRSRAETDAERALSEHIGSGCRFPVGAYATSDAGSMTLRAAAFSIDGQKSIILQKTGSADDPAGLGRAAASEMRERGVEELALNWREKVAEWNRS